MIDEDEVVGINLLDGPLGPHKNAYAIGWPPPEEIIAFEVEGKVAVSIPKFETQIGAEFGMCHLYRKVAQSVFGDKPGNPHIMRGATYEAVT